MTPAERLYRIVEDGLCIGCGLCQSVAGPERVQVVETPAGELRPVVVGEVDDATVERIYDVCPGVRVEGLPESDVTPATHVDNVWGPWRRMVRAWATDPSVRFEGSAGGVLTALAIYLLETGRVSFVLHARASRSRPTFGERHVSVTREDVLAGAGSRYGPAAPLIDVHQALARGEPFAFVGKPCDVAALRNLARHDPRVHEQVRYWLAPVCGGYMPTASTGEFLRRHDVDPDEVTALRYRGRGCPGPTRIETATRVMELDYVDLWGEDSSQWSLPFRCKVCPDGIGEAADVAVADAWPGGAPERGASEWDPGVNAVVVRTERGRELMEAAGRDGALTFEYDVTPDEMSRYQPHQMRKKYAVWARYQGLLEEGRLAPRTERLRIRELAGELPESFHAQQREGTRRRVRDGRTSESTPVAADGTGVEGGGS